MDPDDVEFWDFSWDEMGKFDLPAMIDQILLMTSAEKIHYVGHSMGTTMFMAMTNLRPEYQDKIIMANFLAPVAYVEHMQSPIRYIAPFAGSIDVSTKFLKGSTKAPLTSNAHLYVMTPVGIGAPGNRRVLAQQLADGPVG